MEGIDHLNKKKLQEVEYALPYHWLLKKNTRKGTVFFGYWQLAIDAAGTIKGKHVLDAGCGDGYFTYLLSRHNPASLIGIDASERAINFARILVPQAEFYHGDIASLPYSNELFDVIFLIEVFEHLSKNEKKRVVDELTRVLKKGGRLIVTVPSVYMPVIDKHEEHFTPSSLVQYFNKLSPVKIIGQDRGGIAHKIFWWLFRFWKNRFWHVPFMVNLWTIVLYPRFFNKTNLNRARRIIAVFEK